MATIVRVVLILAVTMSVAATSARAQTIGVRGGVGTDVSLGVAYGGGVNFLIPAGKHSIEPGVLFFGGTFSESSTSGIHTYDEETKLLAFALMGNYLFNYSQSNPGTFFILGFGLGAVSVDWTESSKTDTSLGPQLPGGGSTHSDDGITAGTVFNLGFGQAFGPRFDVRIEVPVILTFSPPGGTSSVIPTFIATAGYRF